jgi:hypothetical protein
MDIVEWDIGWLCHVKTRSKTKPNQKTIKNRFIFVGLVGFERVVATHLSTIFVSDIRDLQGCGFLGCTIFSIVLDSGKSRQRSYYWGWIMLERPRCCKILSPLKKSL